MNEIYTYWEMKLIKASKFIYYVGSNIYFYQSKFILNNWYLFEINVILSIYKLLFIIFFYLECVWKVYFNFRSICN